MNAIPGTGRTAPRRVRVAATVVTRTVGEELVVLDLASERYFGLDAVGRVVWDSISGGATVDEAVHPVLAAFDVNEAVARQDVGDLVADLVGRGLLIEEFE